MKKLNLFLIAFLIPAVLFFTSCGEASDKENKKDTAKKEQVKKEINHTQLLLDKIVANGDFINSKRVPTMITASAVNEAKEGEMLVLDLRKAKDFAGGHIKGAVNVKLNNVLKYVKENDTKGFKKVVMVCYSGQTASFAASVLEILGYNNVYAMKWGMASWNPKYGNKFLKNVSDKFAGQLETTANKKAEKGKLPKFDCKGKTGDEILAARANKIMNDGLHNYLITVDKVMENASDYYIINYWPAKAYNIGHIAGAVRYQPKKSLNLKADLLTLPTDKKIVVYCFTGQHSAFVTAYLRMLGYDAYSLKFGSNSFMNKMLKENEDLGHGFSKKAINNFKLETSKYEAPKDGAAEEEGGC